MESATLRHKGVRSTFGKAEHVYRLADSLIQAPVTAEAAAVLGYTRP